MSRRPPHGMPVGQPTYHRKSGDAIGYDAEVESMQLRCSCGHVQAELLASDLPWRGQVAGVTCSDCGLVGAMAREPGKAAA